MLQALAGVVLLQLLYWICREAYEIRLYAVEEFGRVIHEFDPYFNYRATEVSEKPLAVATCCVPKKERFRMLYLYAG